jgi:hypothetical protein
MTTSERLQDEEEILFRQIHPKFYEDGHLSSSPFVPSAKDENQMSVDRSSLITAAGSFDLYTGNGYQSVAVFGVTVGECGAVGLSCHPDPLRPTETQKANQAHCYVDYSTVGSSKGKNIAKRLRNDAVKRGRLHPRA